MQPYWCNDTHGLVLYHGDCRAVIPALTEQIDLCFTDPPWNVQRDGISNDDLTADEYIDWLGERYAMLPVSKLLAFSSSPTLDQALAAVRAGGFEYVRMLACFSRGRNPAVTAQRWVYMTEYVIVAQRPGATWEGEAYAPDWYEQSPFDGRKIRWGEKRSHPSRKRLGTVQRIMYHASLPGQTVLDPFVGSGTTLLACYLLGRRGIGVEIDEQYCELTVTRLEQEISQGRLFDHSGAVLSSKPNDTQSQLFGD